MKPRRIAAFLLIWILVVGCMPAMAQTQSAQTTLSGSSDAKLHNISLVCDTLDGWVILSGETFSFNEAVGPRTAEAGFQNAKNGRGAKVRGGGVAQAATTLYLAAREMDALSIGEIRTYGAKFADNYVSDPDDAIITDYKAGTDFTFTNWGETIALRMWMDDENLYCTIKPRSEQVVSGAAIAIGETFAGTSGARVGNIALAAQKMDGTILQPGEEFSFNAVVGPRTSEYGYRNAVNGRGVKVCGGGVAQAASTLYLAVKEADFLTVTQKRTYGKNFNQDYVADPDDAIVTDYNAGTDFAFRNDTGAAVEISMEITDFGFLRCTITAQEDDFWADEDFWDDEDFLPEDDWFETEDDFWDHVDEGEWVLNAEGDWVWQWN